MVTALGRWHFARVAQRDGSALSNHRVVVLAKPFELHAAGKGLAPLLGTERAASVAQAFLIDTIVDLQAGGYHPIVAWKGEGPHPELGMPQLESWSQGSGNLGTRLQGVVERATADGSIAIVIGSDTPGMPQGLIDGAIRRLQDATDDAVVGPSHGGGFYLLGVRHLAAGVFDGVTWGTRGTYDSLVRRLYQHRLRTALLEPWFDIDEPNDLDRLVDLLQRGVVRAPRTSEALGFGGGF